MRPRVFIVPAVVLMLSGTVVANGVSASRPTALRTSTATRGTTPPNHSWTDRKQGPSRRPRTSPPMPTLPADVPTSSPQVSAPPSTGILTPRTTPTATTPNTTADPSPAPSPPPSSPPNPVPGCIGAPLTSQSQVQPNTSYCGGHATSRIVLADNDTWTSGEVSGAVAGQQQGAVECGNPCHLYNMNIHDNPRAFAGIYSGGPAYESGPMVVSGGRVSGSGSLGIGGGVTNHLTISGVEIDHNGAAATCGFEGGGFKGVNQGSRFTGNYVHDNNCVGVWYDISADNNEIDHNRVDNNSDGGIFYEISFNASIHDNEASGNGAGACAWLWGAGIGIASSGGVQIYNNTLTNNCNAIAETQQSRGASGITGGLIPVGTPYLLENVSVTGNRVSGNGRTGAVQDNGSVLSTRNLTWSGNAFSNGLSFCGLSC